MGRTKEERREWGGGGGGEGGRGGEEAQRVLDLTDEYTDNCIYDDFQVFAFSSNLTENRAEAEVVIQVEDINDTGPQFSQVSQQSVLHPQPS